MEPTELTISSMSLGQIESLASRRAAEKGFSQAELVDDAVLEFPVGVACMEMQLMEAVEKHRKGLGGMLFEHPCYAEGFGQSTHDFRNSGRLEKLTPAKKYLITKLLLISTEVAEAIEAVMELGTDNCKTSQLMVAEEIADVVIRALGMENEIKAAYPDANNTSVAQAVAEKIVYNAGRPQKHGNKAY